MATPRPFNPQDYGSALSKVLTLPAPDGLVHGLATAAAEMALSGLTVETAFAGPLPKPDMARACLAGLWLLFDFGERGHAMAQALHGKTGDYWHAIHHRREPDYANAKYWFRRVDAHPIHEHLLDAARPAGNGSAAADIITGWSAWDPFGFVDLCSRHAGDGTADESFCKAVQAREWELLFDYGYRQATNGE